MTVYNRGDVVLVNFIFADERGSKRRPAVIVSSEIYNKKRDESDRQQTPLDTRPFLKIIGGGLMERLLNIIHFS